MRLSKDFTLYNFQSTWMKDPDKCQLDFSGLMYYFNDSVCFSYAPWCPACKGLQSTWEDLASASKELSVTVGQVDVTVSPGLSGRFMVTALPTIFQ